MFPFQNVASAVPFVEHMYIDWRVGGLIPGPGSLRAEVSVRKNAKLFSMVCLLLSLLMCGWHQANGDLLSKCNHKTISPK